MLLTGLKAPVQVDYTPAGLSARGVSAIPETREGTQTRSSLDERSVAKAFEQ